MMKVGYKKSGLTLYFWCVLYRSQ